MFQFSNINDKLELQQSNPPNINDKLELYQGDIPNINDKLELVEAGWYTKYYW